MLTHATNTESSKDRVAKPKQGDIEKNQLPSKTVFSEKRVSVQATEKCDDGSIMIRKRKRADSVPEESLKQNVHRVKQMASPLRKAKQLTQSKDSPANQTET